MVNSSKRFFFDDRFSDDSRLPKILNATLEHDLYNFNIIGEKTIVEDEIQGRDEPYLYDVDLKPLEFKMTIAFENYETIDEVTKVIKWLYNPKTYKRLSFDDMENNFFVIFIGSPEYYYVGNNTIGFNKYIGYITCTVRANAPYGYTDILTGTTNTGDLEVYPSFLIENTSGGLNTVTLTHNSNGSSFMYKMIKDEKLEFNGYTKTLTSDKQNPYPAWVNKNYLEFNTGVNVIDISGNNQTIEYAYRAPKYL